MPKTSLKKKKSKTVGFWMDVHFGLKLELDTYAGCQKYAREAGWKLVLDPSLKRLHRWKPERKQYDGILTRVTPEIATAAQKAGVPLVNLWLNSPMLENLPSVVLDCEAAGELAAEHLIGRGLRSFGYLGSRRHLDADLQLKGFRKRLAADGFECSAYRYPLSVLNGRARLWKKFAAGMDQWIESWQPPVGVFVCQDVFCRILIDFCKSHGLSVPGDVAIVGGLNDDIICESQSPTLSSIDEGHAHRGYEAAALLDRLMAGKEPPDKPIRLKPVRLVLRESSDVFASSDPQVAQALRYIVAHGNRLLDVPEIVAEVGVSRRTLERRFQKSVGRSIAEETLRLRLNRAKRRLVVGDVLLKTVAQESGFRTSSHFSRVFTKEVGITPSEYRAQRCIKR